MHIYGDLVKKLKLLLVATFNEVANGKDLFEFEIFTDQDVTSIVIYYNTYTHFANQLRDWFLKHKMIVSSDRWSMPEWYGQLGKEYILRDEVNNELGRIGQVDVASRPDPYFKDKDKLLDLLYQALVEVREEGLFDSMDEHFILYLQQADSPVDHLMRNRIKELVGDKYYSEFLYDFKDLLV